MFIIDVIVRFVIIWNVSMLVFKLVGRSEKHLVVFIVMNIDKIHRIRSLFKEKYIYRKNDWIRGINYMKLS